MDESRPVTAFIFFRVPPQLEQIWEEVWTEIRDSALAQPDCRLFHLLRDPDDHTARVVLTEWGSVADFDTFVRDAGLLWCERATASAAIPPQHAIFEALEIETELARCEEARQLVTVG